METPTAKTSPKIAVKRIAPVKRAGFKLFIVSTLAPKSAPANRVAGGKWLEIEIEPGQHLTGVDVRTRQWRCPILMKQIELVMPCNTGTAGHERVVTIAHRVGGDVAEIGASPRSRLLRHPDGFVSGKED